MNKIWQYINSHIQVRLIAILVPLLILPVIALSAVLINNNTTSLREALRQQQEERLRHEFNELNQVLGTLDDDLSIIANLPSTRALADAIIANDADAITRERRILEDNFKAILSARGIYDKFRFIDSQGLEIVRVEYNPVTNEVTTILERDLQLKANSDYFASSIALPEGNVYVSQMELNREELTREIAVSEDGSVTPVIRYAQPIYVNNPATGIRQAAGIVISNVFAETIFESIRDVESENTLTSLMNEDGYFLYNSSNPNLNFGFEEGLELANPDFIPEASNITALFSANDVDALLNPTNRTTQITTEREDRSFLTSYVRVAPPFANYYWTLVNARDLDELFGAAQQTASTIFLAVIAIALGLAILVSIVTRQLTEPITAVTEKARRLASGVFNEPVEENVTRRHDELGELARSFNTMATELQTSVMTLENRVEARTADLATSAEIAATANQIRDLNELLSLTVNLIRDRFDFYYVQAYIIDEDGKYAVLHEGTGYVGRRLLAQNHKLPLNGRSLVANTVRTGSYSVVQDTQADPNFLANLLLPETRSELTVPLKANNKIIGALDIQHNVANPFDESARNLFQGLADQLSTTFENVQLYENTQKRAAELATVANVSLEASLNLNLAELLPTVAKLTRDNFNLYHAHIYLLDEENGVLRIGGGAGEAGLIMVQRGHNIPLDRENSLVAIAARTKEGIIVNNTLEDENFLPNELLPQTRAEMAVPMLLGEEVIGVLDIQSEKINRFTEEDVQIMTTLARQIAVAVQNSRSFDAVESAKREIERVYNNSIDMIGSANFAGYFVALNPAWERVTGFTREELFKEPFISFVHPDDLELTLNEAAKLSTGVEAIAFTNRYQHKDGGWRWISWNSFPDTETELIHFVARDITEQHDQEEQIRRQGRIIETSQDFIALTTLDGVIEYLNPGGVKMMGFASLEEAIGTVIPDYHTREDAEYVLQKGLPEVFEKGIWITENRLKTREGNLITVEQTLFSVTNEDGTPRSIATIMTDITQRKQFENDIIKRARELETVARVSAEATSNLNIDEMLLNVVNLTKTSFDLYHAHIYLIDEDRNNLIMAAGAGDVGQRMKERKHAIKLQSPISIVARVAREGVGTIINDVTTATGYLPNPLLPDARAELAVPLKIGDNILGVLDVQSEDINAFTEENVRIFSTFANQIAVAIQNAHLFEETQKRAKELEIIAEVSAAATTILDLNELLKSVSELTRDRFGLYHAHVYLLREDELVLTAGAGQAGEVMKKAKHHIPVAHPNSIVARSARTRKSVIINNVATNPDYLPNPLLPETKSEMAVPMIVGETLVGILDVQSNIADRFDANDIRIKTTLADQIAVAVQNALAFERERETVERLTEVDRLKQEFLANMSHELRTPLNSIIGYSEVLIDGVDGDLEEDALEDVTAIHSSGKHLLNIINEILDLAKIDAGQMELNLRDIALDTILAEVTRSSMVLVKDKSVEMNLVKDSDIPLVKGDQVRLNQIMLNLVGNAIKFTEKGSINIRYGMYDENFTYVRVEDTGIGMEAEALSVIFERFRQVDGSSTRRAGGTGLGLTITRQLIQMHGGDIWAESEINTGSAFTFILPIVGSTAQAPQNLHEKYLHEDQSLHNFHQEIDVAFNGKQQLVSNTEISQG